MALHQVGEAVITPTIRGSAAGTAGPSAAVLQLVVAVLITVIVTARRRQRILTATAMSCIN
jgi:hypothetical protein